MARIVLGVGASHGPQINIPPEKWYLLQEKDRNDTRIPYQALLAEADPSLEERITLENFRRDYEECHQAIAILKNTLSEVAPDVILMVGDDQHELFLDDNIPMFNIFRGESFRAVKKTEGLADWQKAEIDVTDYSRIYPAHQILADHIIGALIAEGFDLSVSHQLRKGEGLGHAFMFLYQRLLDSNLDIPMIPVSINTFYPPNQATPKRCYQFGQALKRAVESWSSDLRVAVAFSGGLSHTILDEELDRTTLRAMEEKDVEALCSLPVEKLVNGTSEIRNWIAASGALEGLEMQWKQYLPCYRTPAGTGCGMGFAYWK